MTKEQIARLNRTDATLEMYAGACFSSFLNPNDRQAIMTAIHYVWSIIVLCWDYLDTSSNDVVMPYLYDAVCGWLFDRREVDVHRAYMLNRSVPSGLALTADIEQQALTAIVSNVTACEIVSQPVHEIGSLYIHEHTQSESVWADGNTVEQTTAENVVNAGQTTYRKVIKGKRVSYVESTDSSEQLYVKHKNRYRAV